MRFIENRHVWAGSRARVPEVDFRVFTECLSLSLSLPVSRMLASIPYAPSSKRPEGMGYANVRTESTFEQIPVMLAKAHACIFIDFTADLLFGQRLFQCILHRSRAAEETSRRDSWREHQCWSARSMIQCSILHAHVALNTRVFLQ